MILILLGVEVERSDDKRYIHSIHRKNINREEFSGWEEA